MSKNTIKQNWEIIDYDTIRDMTGEKEVFVNTNRIYWQLSEELRNQRRKEVIKELVTVIETLSDDKRMYIPMDVEIIKECFESQKDELPNNTFRYSSEGLKSTSGD